MKRTVVLLLSDKRSGSTMLQRELCRHADIQHVLYSPHRYFETHHWLKAAVMLESPAEQFSGGKTYPGYGSRANAAAYLRDCVSGNLGDFDFAHDDRQMIFESWEGICEKYAQPVFFEKSPQYLANWAALSLILEWMEQTDFEVKIIGLVRNPMSVQHSAQELFGTDPQERQFGWLEMYENLLRLERRIDSPNYCLVRYEDLIAKPVEGFTELLQFLNLPADESLGAQVHARSADKWSYDSGFDLQLADSVREMALRFGYSDEDLRNPHFEASAADRKRRGGVFYSLNKRLVRFRFRVLHPLLARLRIHRR